MQPGIVFESEDHREFRSFDIDIAPWFALNDVCRALGIEDAGAAASYLGDDETAAAHTDAPAGGQSIRIVNEAGLYSLILRSNHPEAARLRQWIAPEENSSESEPRNPGAMWAPSPIRKMVEALKRRFRRYRPSLVFDDPMRRPDPG